MFSDAKSEINDFENNRKIDDFTFFSLGKNFLFPQNSQLYPSVSLNEFGKITELFSLNFH